MNLHGKKGEITGIEFDDAASVTGDPKDNFMYTIELKNGNIPEIHFRRRDIKKIED